MHSSTEVFSDENITAGKLNTLYFPQQQVFWFEGIIFDYFLLGNMSKKSSARKHF